MEDGRGKMKNVLLRIPIFTRVRGIGVDGYGITKVTMIY